MLRAAFSVILLAPIAFHAHSSATAGSISDLRTPSFERSTDKQLNRLDRCKSERIAVNFSGGLLSSHSAEFVYLASQAAQSCTLAKVTVKTNAGDNPGEFELALAEEQREELAVFIRESGIDSANFEYIIETETNTGYLNGWVGEIDFSFKNMRS